MNFQQMNPHEKHLNQVVLNHHTKNTVNIIQLIFNV